MYLDIHAEGRCACLQEDAVVTEIERRIARVTQLPLLNGEGLQILHYVDGQKYEPHHDFFHDAVNQAPEMGGQRVATILMYLCGPTSIFLVPNLQFRDPSPVCLPGAEASACLPASSQCRVPDEM